MLNTVTEAIVEGLYTDGSHHKQEALIDALKHLMKESLQVRRYVKGVVEQYNKDMEYEQPLTMEEWFEEMRENG